MSDEDLDLNPSQRPLQRTCLAGRWFHVGFGWVDLTKWRIACRVCGHEPVNADDLCEHMRASQRPSYLT